MANDKRLITKQRERASELPDAFINCRLTGHWWVLAAAVANKEGGVDMNYQCHRCSTHRNDTISPRYGELLRRGYDYAEGYRVKQSTPGERTFSAAALRADTWRRSASS